MSLVAHVGQHPVIVVINLFQNDAWVRGSPHSPAEQEEIISAYENLLLKIRAGHPIAAEQAPMAAQLTAFIQDQFRHLFDH